MKFHLGHKFQIIWIFFIIGFSFLDLSTFLYYTISIGGAFITFIYSIYFTIEFANQNKVEEVKGE